jgi:caffeoyl-CoA O-methyltransferase
MSNRTIAMSDELYTYFLSISLRESPLLQELRAETAKMPLARMQIAPEQGQFMALLVELMSARRIIEIGVFTGYSSLCMASAMPDDGLIVACDLSVEWTDIAKRYWQRAGVAHKIDLRIAPAIDTLNALLETQTESYDIAFLDADKENYPIYYEQCLRLLRPGGLMIIDNVLWSGRVADPSNDEPDTLALRSFNHKLHNDPRISLSILPIADGLSLARKR